MENFANGNKWFFSAFSLLAATVGFLAFRSPNVDQPSEGSSIWLAVVACMCLSIGPAVNSIHDFCRRQSSSFGRVHPVITWVTLIPNIFLILLWNRIDLKIQYAVCCGQIVFISNILLKMGFTTSIPALVTNSLGLPLCLCVPLWFPLLSPSTLGVWEDSSL